MTAPQPVLDRLTRVTPLGLRFWDVAAGKVVGNGLSVTATPPDNPARIIPATLNRSGIYLFQNLPGLREVEHGAGDADFWLNPPQRTFIIDVIDSQRRYQPFRFAAQIPTRDLFTLDCLPETSPPNPPSASIPLHPARTYSVPPGLAVLRAHLRQINDQPAAWAVLEVRRQGQLLGRSFADRDGQLLVAFPYPEPLGPEFTSPPNSPPGSPPFGERPRPTEQSWTLQLDLFFSPSVAAAAIPDLCEVLGQPPAMLSTALSPLTPLTEVTLEFGKELVIKSSSESVLWVS